MPAHNAALFVADAIRSITQQTFEDFEIIVVDDASTDGTGDIVADIGDPRVKLLRNPANLGLFSSLNVALSVAQGTYLARMDADDLSLPDRFERQNALLDANPGVTVCGSDLELFGDVQSITDFPADDATIKANFMEAAANMGDAPSMFRHDFIAAHRIRWDGSFICGGDLAFWVACMRQGAVFANIKAPLYRYRRHSGCSSHRSEETARTVRHIRKGLFPEFFPNLTGEEVDALLDIFDGGNFSFNGLCNGVSAAIKAQSWAGSRYGENRSHIRERLQYRIDVYRRAILKS